MGLVRTFFARSQGRGSASLSLTNRHRPSEARGPPRCRTCRCHSKLRLQLHRIGSVKATGERLSATRPHPGCFDSRPTGGPLPVSTALPWPPARQGTHQAGETRKKKKSKKKESGIVSQALATIWQAQPDIKDAGTQLPAVRLHTHLFHGLEARVREVYESE